MGRPGGNPNRPPLPPPGTNSRKGSKNKLSRARVEEELRRIALLDPINFFQRNGRHSQRWSLRELSQMPPEARACISGLKVRTENLTAGDDKQDTVVEIKLCDKVKSLELCARYLKMIDDRTVLSVNLEDIEKRLRAGQQRNAERARGRT